MYHGVYTQAQDIRTLLGRMKRPLTKTWERMGPQFTVNTSSFINALTAIEQLGS